MIRNKGADLIVATEKVLSDKNAVEKVYTTNSPITNNIYTYLKYILSYGPSKIENMALIKLL